MLRRINGLCMYNIVKSVLYTKTIQVIQYNLNSISVRYRIKMRHILCYFLAGNSFHES